MNYKFEFPLLKDSGQAMNLKRANERVFHHLMIELTRKPPRAVDNQGYNVKYDVKFAAIYINIVQMSLTTSLI